MPARRLALWGRTRRSNYQTRPDQSPAALDCAQGTGKLARRPALCRHGGAGQLRGQAMASSSPCRSNSLKYRCRQARHRQDVPADMRQRDTRCPVLRLTHVTCFSEYWNTASHRPPRGTRHDTRCVILSHVFHTLLRSSQDADTIDAALKRPCRLSPAGNNTKPSHDTRHDTRCFSFPSHDTRHNQCCPQKPRRLSLAGNSAGPPPGRDTRKVSRRGNASESL